MPFAEGLDKKQIELGDQLAPKFGADGLIPAVATDATTGDVLMFAYMNAEALEKTITTGEAHYYSRSRAKLWKKGESSGHVQKVLDLRVDCDQDAVWMKVDQQGGGACHTGYHSCFYRRAPIGSEPGRLEQAETEKVFDPEEVYGH